MSEDEKYEWLKEAVDETRKMVRSVEQTLVEQHVTLAEHIRRTGLAEDNIALLRSEVKPLLVRDAMFAQVGKLLVALAAIATIAVSITKLLGG